MIEDKVIAKIRKMLAIANDAGASDGERDNAVRMVHAYMVKHNLSSSEIEETQEERIKDSLDVKGGSPWKRTCIQGIADLFFCKYFYTQSYGGRPEKTYFIGLESNTVTAKEMSVFIINSIQKEGRKLTRDNDETSEFRRSFLYGAANEIYRRCGEIKAASMKKPDEPTETGTSMVLANFYETEKTNNEQFLRDLGVNTKKTAARRGSFNSAGYQAGKRFGNTVQLNNQIR